MFWLEVEGTGLFVAAVSAPPLLSPVAFWASGQPLKKYSNWKRFKHLKKR